MLFAILYTDSANILAANNKIAPIIYPMFIPETYIISAATTKKTIAVPKSGCIIIKTVGIAIYIRIRRGRRGYTNMGTLHSRRSKRLSPNSLRRSAAKPLPCPSH